MQPRPQPRASRSQPQPHRLGPGKRTALLGTRAASRAFAHTVWCNRGLVRHGRRTTQAMHHAWPATHAGWVRASLGVHSLKSPLPARQWLQQLGAADYVFLWVHSLKSPLPALQSSCSSVQSSVSSSSSVSGTGSASTSAYLSANQNPGGSAGGVGQGWGLGALAACNSGWLCAM